MNSVQLIGELVSSVETHRGRITGRHIGKTMLAVHRGTKGDVDFVPVTLRDREAEMGARYLGDGSLVAVEGHLHSAVMAAWDANERPVTYLRLPRRVERTEP
jgi:single-stranded DNA-binding protein